MRKIFTLTVSFLMFQGFAQGLSGNMTIGGASADFESIGEAINALQTDGVANGGVTFMVAAGTYDENVVINAISGASAENRIRFVAANPNEKSVIRAIGTTAFNDAVIRLNGASFITFDGFRLEDRGAAIATEVEYGIFLNGLNNSGCQFNEFKNIEIFMGVPGFETTQRTRGVWSNSAAPAGSPQFGNHGNLYENMSIDNVAGGMALRGTFNAFSGAPTQVDTSNVVRNVIMGSVRRIGHELNFGASGINAASQRNLLVEGVVIDSLRTQGATALPVTIAAFSYDNASGIIRNSSVNFIESAGTNGTPMGIRASILENEELFIYNNTIANIKRANFVASTSDPSMNLIGIWIFRQTGGGGTAKIYHNSIYLDSEAAVSYRSAGIQLRAASVGSNPIEIFNNIVVNNISTTSDTYRAFALVDGNVQRTFWSSNNNVLQADGDNGAIGGIGFEIGGPQTAALTLQQFSTISGGDTDSVSKNVIFIDAQSGDLRIDEELSVNLSLYGVPFNALIPLDLLGNTRTQPVTGAGAFEIQGITASIDDFTSLSNSFRAFPNPFKSSLTVESGSHNISNIKIYDFVGKEVFQTQAEKGMLGTFQQTLNLDNLQPGMYFVQLINNSGTALETIKVLKN